MDSKIENLLGLLQELRWFERWDREKDMCAIKEKVLLSDSLHESDFEDVKAVVAFFRKSGYSINDVLIRCCTDITYVGGHYAPIFRYYELWKMLNKMGYLVDEQVMIC